MGKVPLDWRLEQIPNDTETRPSPGPVRPVRGSHSVSRRTLVVLLGVLLLLAAGAWLFTRLGWQHLRQQVEREIAYEDAQSRAGRVDLVLELQAPDLNAWRQLRASEAAAGLPAPLPAAGLAPTDSPAQIIQFVLSGDNVYAVLVRRSFVDSAGQDYHFDLWQRYRNLAPGQWQRLQPDETALTAATTWTGRALTARFPLADQAVLEPALAQVDSAVAQTCLDWACPPDFTLQLTFTAAINDLSIMTPTLRASGQSIGPYPVVFDAALDSGSAPDGLALPSPHLAGLPADPAAAQALAHGLTAQALLNLANQLAGPSPRTADYFRDALAARAEIRLGLAPASAGAPSPGYDQSIEQLWAATRIGPDSLPAAEIDNRLQALRFLNFALKSQPTTVEAALLKQLRQRFQFGDWLLAAFGDPGPALIQAWDDTAASQFAAAPQPDWSALNGLTLVCGDGLWMVRDGRLALLPPRPNPIYLEPTSLSPNGRRLALLTRTPDGQLSAQVLDLATDLTQTVATANVPYVLGWSAQGQLVYLADEQPTAGGPTGLALWRYDPATSTAQRLTSIASREMDFLALWSWSPDHRALALTRQLAPVSGISQRVPVVITVTDPVGLTDLVPAGANPVWSSDGRSVSYVEYRHPLGDAFSNSDVVAQFDAHSQARTDLFTTASLGFGDDLSLADLHWAPDGSRLALSAYIQNTGTRLVSVSAGVHQAQTVAGVPPGDAMYTLDYSADSQFLAYVEFSPSSYASQLMVRGPDNTVRAQLAFYSGTWSPTGHQLAVANAAGVLVTDPATRSLALITTKNCYHVNWYDLNETGK